jgi:hypothetical protein
MRRLLVQWIVCALGLLPVAARAADFEATQRTYNEYPAKTFGQFSDYSGVYEWGGGKGEAGVTGTKGICDTTFKDLSESMVGGVVDQLDVMRRMIIWFEGDVIVIRRFNADHADRGRLSYQSDFPLQSGGLIKIYNVRYDNGNVETIGLWSDKSEIIWEPTITPLSNGGRHIKYNFAVRCHNADDVVQWAKKTLASANRPAFDRSALAASSPEYEQKCFDAPTRKCLLELAMLDVSRSPEIGRDDALEAVAEAQARTGDVAPALLQLAQSARGSNRSDELKAIAVGEVRAGKVDAAREHAKLMQDEVTRDYTLGEVVAGLAKAGRIAEASQLAAGIKFDDVRDRASLAIAEAQADAGRMPEAEQIARSIKDERPRQNALRAVAVAQAKAGNASGAEKIAQSIQMTSPVPTHSAMWSRRWQRAGKSTTRCGCRSRSTTCRASLHSRRRSSNWRKLARSARRLSSRAGFQRIW